jgi:hypothetical protein
MSRECRRNDYAVRKTRHGAALSTWIGVVLKLGFRGERRVRGMLAALWSRTLTDELTGVTSSPVPCVLHDGKAQKRALCVVTFSLCADKKNHRALFISNP